MFVGWGIRCFIIRKILWDSHYVRMNPSLQNGNSYCSLRIVYHPICVAYNVTFSAGESSVF